MPGSRGRMNEEMWKLARRMNQLVDEWMHARFREDPQETWQPAVDMIECDRFVCIVAELAGMSREAVEVRVDGNTVTLSGDRSLVGLDGQMHVHQMELARGAFRRRLTLPFEPRPETVSVTYREGLLEIRIPKPGAAG